MFVVKSGNQFLLDSGFFGYPNIIDAVAGFDNKEEAESTAWSLGHLAVAVQVSHYQLRSLNEAA